MSVPTILIVDGYNAIHAWPQLQRFANGTDLHIARSQLVEKLTGYVSFRGYQCQVIFDSHQQVAPTPPQTIKQIEVVFTDYFETADTVIERMCAQLQWEHCRVRVVTSDRLVQQIALGYDAECTSSQGLLEEVKWAAKQIRRSAKQAQKPGRGIEQFLDAKTRDRLTQWRLSGQDRTKSQ